MSRPSVEVRRACVDDLDDLLLLWAQARADLSRTLRSLGALPVDQMRPRLREALQVGEPTVLLARHERAPAGFAVLRLAPVLGVDGAAVHIDHLYVAPSSRRRGVARALLLAVTGIAERSGADQVLAGAPPAARDTHRFLARLGFSPLVVRRIVGTSALRRRLSGEGQRRGLEDLLSRRRSLRARAGRTGWSVAGWSGGRGGAEEPAADRGNEPVAGAEVARGGSIIIADSPVGALDLGRLESVPLPQLAVGSAARAPSDAAPGAEPRSCPEGSPGGEQVPGQGRRRQRA